MDRLKLHNYCALSRYQFGDKVRNVARRSTWPHVAKLQLTTEWLIPFGNYAPLQGALLLARPSGTTN
jgi:hypothetical protein